MSRSSKRAAIAVAAGLAAFAVAGATAGAAPPVRCAGHAATIVGTAGNDVIVGTKHHDVIAALSGDDVIAGGGGNDTICGGDGTDTISYASATAPVVVDLSAGTAAGDGNDQLSGIENVVGSPFDDTLTGDAGNNDLAGGAGNDSLVGGGGSDTADYAAATAAVTVDLGAGTATGDGSDTLSSIENATGSSFDDDLFGDVGQNVLTGGAGSDLLQSFAGSDVLNGGSGDDIIRGGDGADAADGGDGTDVCVDAETRTSCERGGGTLTAELATDLDYTDPALDYLSSGWQLEYATCLKLMNFPDDGSALAVPVPEAATGLPLVSADGKTYTFTIRSGIQFSPPSNEALTAESFKHEFDRVLSPVQQSPGAQFVSDVVSVTATGQTLTIVLNAPAPDFLARLTMPFFCAVPTDLPIVPNGVLTLASAGPYSIVARQPNVSIELARNPNYRGRRPSTFDRIVYEIGKSVDQEQADVESGAADYAASGIPPANYAAVNALYGPGSPAAAAGRQRFFVNPQLGLSYLGLNTSRPVFANEILRQAVATALDRGALLAFNGAFAGAVTDQLLPPGTPGFVDQSIYPLGGDLAAAAALAASQGVTPASPVPVVLYTSDRGSAPARAQLIKDTLAQIGFDVTIDAFSRAEQIQREGTLGEPFDMTTEGWILDYNDPFDLINVLLDGNTIKATGNNNVSYFNDPVFNARMEAAEQLTGQARYDAYASLDHDLSVAAPLVALSNFNARDYFSDRVGCQAYNSFGMDLAALCIH